MFMGLEKTVAFPESPCQVYVWCSARPSGCLTHLSHRVANIVEAVFD